MGSLSQLSLRLIRTFHEVSRAGSFTAAASELGISQPAVSQQIRELEAVLGAILFRRRGRGVELTQAGEKLASSVDPAVKLLDEGLAGFLAQRSPNRVELRANSTFAMHWLIPRLGSFLQRHPNIELDLSSSYWAEHIDPDHSAVHIDFGVPPHAARPFGHPDVVIAVANPATARRITKPDDLANETLLDIRGGDNWTSYTTAINLDRPQTRSHTSMTYQHTLALAEAGHGIALAHRFLIQDNLRQGTLVQIVTPPTPAQEHYFLVAPPPARTNAATLAFLDWIHEAADQPASPQPA